ncbi:hypothetical protein A3Q56_08680 [Intoshia linei]|uniref:Uncharacterized protein n=1 Tax=Intoshia linei TaxID=1819745 RepID=A0A177AQS7_9BILA|nr:hypothetical protein A3Q56_08680 [Intoshia linei]
MSIRKECETERALKRKQSYECYQERSSLRMDLDNTLLSQYSDVF